MIQGLISMMSTTSASLESQFQLRDNYFNMQNYLVGRGEGMEQILQGLINQPAQEMDRSEKDNFEIFTEFQFKLCQICDRGRHKFLVPRDRTRLWQRPGGAEHPARTRPWTPRIQLLAQVLWPLLHIEHVQGARRDPKQAMGGPQKPLLVS